jgi:hypothetical protein
VIALTDRDSEKCVALIGVPVEVGAFAARDAYGACSPPNGRSWPFARESWFQG